MTLKEEVQGIYNNRPKHIRDAGKNGAEKSEDKFSLFPKLKRYRILLLIMATVAAGVLLSMILVDILPGDLMTTMIVVMLMMLLVCSLLFSSKKKRRRVFGIILAIIYLFIFGTTIGYVGKTYAMMNKITGISLQSGTAPAKHVNVTEEPFNVYLTGIDQWESERGEDLERSDVNMILTINPSTKKILLTSIPRDAYVELYTAKQMDKLTHTGVYGVDETINTVQKWLGIDLNYYVKINFSGVRDMVDAMGGIDVYSPVAFSSSIRDFSYDAGWNHLGGNEALYFARERKSFEGLDSARVDNQQRVMQAIIKKMTSSATLLTKYGDIVDAAGINLETNFTSDELQNLVKMQIAELASWDIENQKIEGEYGEDYVASLTQSMKFSVYYPDEDSVNMCNSNIEMLLNADSGTEAGQKAKRSRSFFINMMRRIFKDNETSY